MIIEFDTAKREKTLLERGLDFADSGKVFQGLHFTAPDDRFDYGEDRFITVGTLDDRIVVLVWTPRNEARRIISMRYANDREISRYKTYLR
ncbi:BrnT family toxin [Geomobilimonas luticola]|uniref:BrnT family toxin n=1 Tax=Geomobilimonas luticola TaxID=1114878 RepID=A0ABS5SF55_9BACT|nr:BrnT family toxin [Geomobilimonas luticola]